MTLLQGRWSTSGTGAGEKRHLTTSNAGRAPAITFSQQTIEKQVMVINQRSLPGPGSSMGTPGGVVASKLMTMKVVSQNAGSRVSCVGLNQPQEKEQPRLPHSYLRGLIPALGRGHWGRHTRRGIEQSTWTGFGSVRA